MKAIDLMHAMDGVEDGILLEAEQPKKTRRRVLPRLAAAAAIIGLLCVTVYAAFGGVTLHLDDKNTSWLFSDFQYEGIDYSRVTFEYRLDAVEISENATAFLNDMLAPCDWWLLDESKLIPAMNYHTHKFASLGSAETFFGLQFQLPDIVRESKIGTRQIELDAKAMYYPDDQPRHEGYGFSYEPDLGGANLFYNALPRDDQLSSISVFVYLALTEEFAQIPYSAGFFCAMDLYGEPEVLECRIGGEEFTILTFPDSPDPYADVLYVRDGIGYQLKFYPAEGYESDLVKLVRAYLKDL